MKEILLNTGTGTSRIHIGESTNNVIHYISSQKTVIITDHNVRKLHGKLFPSHQIIEIRTGEGTKTLRTVEKIYNTFLNLELDRSSCVLGIGGGIVCDIAGFCASTYMRGLHFGFVPTTLLAQVDAGIGGKNGVNFRGYKNIVGVISQPEFVLIDFSYLKTLPEREFSCGMAEIIKAALIKSPELFRYLESNRKKASVRDPEVMHKAVGDAIAIKTALVEKDAGDHGERRLLNFGHTFGHALEKIMNIPHGQAVSTGMVASASFSESKGWLSNGTTRRIKELIESFNLPTRIPCSAGAIMEAVRKDKKRQNQDIHFVLLAGIGKAKLKKIPYKELETWIHDMHKYL